MIEPGTLKNIGQIIIPEAIRQIAQIAISNPDRKEAQQRVLEELPYPSERLRAALKEGAFGYFELTRTSIVVDPFLMMAANAPEGASHDIILYKTLVKYPVFVATLKALESTDGSKTQIADTISDLFQHPKGVKDSLSKVLVSLRNFGLITEGRKPERLPYTFSLEGLGYILHAEFPERHAVTATLEQILQQPHIKLIAQSQGFAGILGLLEEGSHQKYWALERTAVFSRVVFIHTLDEYVSCVVGR